MTPPNENWQVGDLALCVGRRDWKQVCGQTRPSNLPRPGGVYTVDLVIEEPIDGALHTFLGFYGILGGYEARVFRKIRRLSDEEHRQAREDLLGPEVVR